MSDEIDKLTNKELLDVLDLWIKDEWNIKGGMMRALAFKGKKERVNEVTDEVILRQRAYRQIVALIKSGNE